MCTGTRCFTNILCSDRYASLYLHLISANSSNSYIRAEGKAFGTLYLDASYKRLSHRMESTGAQSCNTATPRFSEIPLRLNEGFIVVLPEQRLGGTLVVQIKSERSSSSIIAPLSDYYYFAFGHSPPVK